MNSETFIQSELVKNELNQLDLQYQAIKEQKYNELLIENKQLKGVIKTYEILLKTQQKQIYDVKEWFKEKQRLTDIDDVCDTDYFWKIWGDNNE